MAGTAVTGIVLPRDSRALANVLMDQIRNVVTDLEALRAELTVIGTTLADYKTIYDAHTHECPGSSFAASRCSVPDTGAAENSLTASAASAFTDTSTSPAVSALVASNLTPEGQN